MVKISLAVFLAALLSVAIASAVPYDAREARIVKVRALREAAEQANLAKRQGNSAFGHSQGNGRGNGNGNGNNGNGNGNNNSGNGNGNGNSGNGNGNGNSGNGNGNGNNGSNNGNGNNGNGNGNGNGGVPPPFQFDPYNCGSRGAVCPASYNGVGTPSCTYGVCSLRCPPGYVNYNSQNPELPSFCAPA
ncbi:hypothetical protein JCM8208_007663 [Rhodotorula glutinis]